MSHRCINRDGMLAVIPLLLNNGFKTGWTDGVGVWHRVGGQCMVIKTERCDELIKGVSASSPSLYGAW